MKDTTLKLIFNEAHAVALNMNDTFYYACADSSCIDIMELDDLEPVIELYGRDAFIAYEALKRGHDPQIPQIANREKFKAAKQLILDLCAKADKYGPFYELRDAIQMEAKSIESRKKISKRQSKLGQWFSFFIGR